MCVSFSFVTSKKLFVHHFSRFFSFRILHPCLFLSPSTLSVFFTMPELPEVEAARQTAEEHLLNKTIVEASAVEDESAFGWCFFFLGLIDGAAISISQPLSSTSTFLKTKTPKTRQKSSPGPPPPRCALCSWGKRSLRHAGTARTFGWSSRKEEEMEMEVEKQKQKLPLRRRRRLLPPLPSCSTSG